MGLCLVTLLMFQEPLSEKAELLQLLSRLQAALDPIACDITDSNPTAGSNCHSRFIKQGRSLRIEELKMDCHFIYLSTDKCRAWYRARGGKEEIGGIDPPEDEVRAPTTLDLREILGLVKKYRGDYLEVAELIQSPDVTIARVNHEGKPFLVLRLEEHHGGAIKTEYWYDVSRQGVLSKKVWNLKSDSDKVIYYSETQVEMYFDAGSGLSLPTLLTAHDYYIPNGSTNKHGLRVSNTAITYHLVQQPIPSSVFQLRFPPGTKVNDQINRRSWKVKPKLTFVPDPAAIASPKTSATQPANDIVDPRILLGLPPNDSIQDALWVILLGALALLLLFGYDWWQRR